MKRIDNDGWAGDLQSRAAERRSGSTTTQTMGRKQLRQVVADAYRYFQDAE